MCRDFGPDVANRRGFDPTWAQVGWSSCCPEVAGSQRRTLMPPGCWCWGCWSLMPEIQETASMLSGWRCRGCWFQVPGSRGMAPILPGWQCWGWPTPSLGWRLEGEAGRLRARPPRGGAGETRAVPPALGELFSHDGNLMEKGKLMTPYCPGIRQMQGVPAFPPCPVSNSSTKLKPRLTGQRRVRTAGAAPGMAQSLHPSVL